MLVKWAGAAYLLWLALGMLRQALRGGAAPEANRHGNAGAAAPGPLFRQGLLTNVLNPKVALFFLALLPQFISSQAPNKSAAFLFLGTWFVVQGFAFLAAFVLLVAPLRRWQPAAWVRCALHGVGGALFAGLAIRLAVTEPP